MPGLFDTLTALLKRAATSRDAVAPASGTRRYECRCGRPVFFRNSACTACGAALGYEPQRHTMVALDAGPAPGLWQTSAQRGDAGGALFARCANFDTAAGCNWLVPAVAPNANTEGVAQSQGQALLQTQNQSAPRQALAAAAPLLCVACRLNRTIPDLSVADNAVLWRRIEIAKRRMVSQLIALRLPVASKLPAANEDPKRGLMFDVLRAPPGGPPVLTGHDDGLITLNLDEADDANRERTRAQMHEPYRTLLGHFRHEVGHYYWDRLVQDTPWIDGYRQLFGDEREDYAAALQRHYEQGPKPDWAQRHVSSYASTHAWEDWAETWAHYLHMVDTLDTALSFGLDASDVEFEFDRFTEAELWQPKDPGAQEFLGFVNAWVEITSVLNELSRCMGQPDYYPFVLPRPVIAKLQFVHLVVRGAAGASH